jgi:ParB/RepB/Spo0J family partition protein
MANTTVETETEAGPPPKRSKSIPAAHFRDVPLKQLVIDQSKNVRTDLGNISDLMSSIEQDGILEPLLGYELEDGRVEIIAGFRRAQAAKQLKMDAVPVHIINEEDHPRYRVALVENLQREDMNALDKARGIHRMMSDLNVDQREAARMLGVSDGYISQYLSVLELPETVQSGLEVEDITIAHANQLNRLTHEDVEKRAKLQAQFYTDTRKRQWTALTLREKVDQYLAKHAPKKKAASKDEGKKRGRPSKVDTLTADVSARDVKPLKAEALFDVVQSYKAKMEKARSGEKQQEYKYVLQGLLIAAGLTES